MNTKTIENAQRSLQLQRAVSHRVTSAMMGMSGFVTLFLLPKKAYILLMQAKIKIIKSAEFFAAITFVCLVFGTNPSSFSGLGFLAVFTALNLTLVLLLRIILMFTAKTSSTAHLYFIAFCTTVLIAYSSLQGIGIMEMTIIFTIVCLFKFMSLRSTNSS